MIFGYFTLMVALVISAVAAYYSIVGLTAIFAAAVVPIIIMGAALEVGKVTAAVWLKINWLRANLTYKIYLVPAVTFLMLLTSMGIFGFLSKAHTDQALISGDVTSKIAIYDEKIKTAKENIESNRRALKQLDEAVDQTMSRSSDERGADRAVYVRKSQAKERSKILQEIEADQKRIIALNDERAPIAAEVRKVEAEVGPVKYVAALIYGDNPDANLLERAVRWVIILIVTVFDPLALVLILAAQQSIRWAIDDQRKAKEDKENKEDILLNKETVANPDVEGKHLQDEPGVSSANEINEVTDPSAPPADDFKITPETHSYLFGDKSFYHRSNDAITVGPMVATRLENPIKAEDSPSAESTLVTETQTKSVPQTEVETVKEAIEPPPKLKIIVPEAYDPKRRQITTDSGLTADNDAALPKDVKAHFGIEFPANPDKGELFLRVDHLPSRLYKFNGNAWIEVDKSMTDSYVYNHDYIKFLVFEIESGHMDPEDLTDSEREQITEFLASDESNSNAT